MATVVFALLGKTLICITYSVLYVFANELFPTEVRNVGVGTASMSARLSSMAASYAGGPLVSSRKTLEKPYVSSICVNFCWRRRSTSLELSTPQ